MLIGLFLYPAESKKGGFTFHETTPIISSSQFNPVQDSEVSVDLSVALVASSPAHVCPQFSVS